MVNEGCTTQPDNLRVSRVAQQSVEHVAAAIEVYLLLARSSCRTLLLRLPQKALEILAHLRRRVPAIRRHRLRVNLPHTLHTLLNINDIGLNRPVNRANQIMNLIHDNHGVVEELLIGWIARHNHQILRANTVVRYESDTPCRVRLRVIFNNRQNLCANLLALFRAQGIIV